MDYYLISRLFRTFRQIEGKYSDEPKNIIIYAGIFHVNQYIKIFKDLEFELIYSSKKEGFQCLNISDFNKYIWIK